MKFFTTKQAWIWAFSSLLMINIAVIGTMMWQRYYDPDHQKSIKDTKKESVDQGHGRNYSQWREEMGFTEEQDAQLKELRRDYRQKTSAIFNEMRENQKLIFEKMAQDDPDRDMLEKLAGETGQLHSRLRKETISHMLAIKAITTPEQYEKMAEFMQGLMFPANLPQHRHSQQEHPMKGKSDTCSQQKEVK